MISPVKRRKHARHMQHLSHERAIDADDVDNHSTLHAVDRSNNISAPKKLRYSIFILLIVVSYRAAFHASNSGLRQEYQSIRPFSSIDKDSHLIGQYTLDYDYAYWAVENETPEDLYISGMIYFPSVDLTTTFREDATNEILRSRLLENTSELFTDISLISEHVNSSHALLTLKGYKEAPNQDRALIVKLFVGNNTTISDPNGYTQNNDKHTKEVLLMGIFDGHGERGHDVSQHVALEFPKTFARLMKQKLINANYDDWLRKVLTTTFVEIDNEEPVKGSGASGGSTASTIFYPGSGSKIYLANVGDSTTIIAHYNKSSRKATIVKQNRKDKPHLEGERRRIEAAGGQVYIPFQHPSSTFGPKDSSRLVITLPGGSQLGLAMSRSIGDAEGKPFGLISEPTVEVFDVHQYYLDMQYSDQQTKDSEWFMIAATDGVFDVIPYDKVVQRLGEGLYITFAVQRTCEQLIREASLLWTKATMQQPYRDDITLGVSKIQLQY